MSRFLLDGVVGDIFEPDEPRGETALFLNGLPGAIGPLPGVLLALELGYHVMFVQYPGTYDSDGLLSPTSPIEPLFQAVSGAAEGTLRSMATGGLVELPSVTAAIAHSYGGFVLTGMLRQHPDIAISKVLLLAPVLSYASEPDVGTREDLLAHLDGVRATRPRTYRIAEDSAWSHVAASGFPCEKVGDWKGTITAFVGTEDDTFDIKVLDEKFESLVVDAVGCTDARLQLVDGAGHGMDELIRDRKRIHELLA